MDWTSFLLGLIASLVASWLFWRYQLQILPRITFCDDIAVEESDNNDLVFRFKVINQGKNQVVNFVCNAWLCELAERGGVKISRAIKQYDIANTGTFTLASKSDEKRPWGLTSETTISFKDNLDLLSILAESPDMKIVATVKATDARSGSTQVIQKSFDSSNIKHGVWKANESTTVFQ